MRLFAIDPGTTRSGWVLLEDGRLVQCGVHDNWDLLQWVGSGQGADYLAVEDMVSMGMPAGEDVLRTAKWIGRFVERWESTGLDRNPRTGPALLVPRRAVKDYLCGTQKAKDANIRQVLIDLFPATGGGATPAVGVKSKPGPLYGIASHAWSALAVAVTAAAQRRIPILLSAERQREMEECA